MQAEDVQTSDSIVHVSGYKLKLNLVKLSKIIEQTRAQTILICKPVAKRSHGLLNFV